MDRFTAADRRRLALILAIIFLLSAAAIGGLGWGAVLVAKVTMSGAQAVLGA